MFPPGARPKGSPELTRLAIPWRTYTDSHLEHVTESLVAIAARKASVRGMRIVSAPPALRPTNILGRGLHGRARFLFQMKLP